VVFNNDLLLSIASGITFNCKTCCLVLIYVDLFQCDIKLSQKMFLCYSVLWFSKVFVVSVLKYRCFFTCIYLSVIIKMFSRKTWWNEITNCVKCFSWIAFSISNRQTIDLAYFIASAAVLSVVWHLTFVTIWKTLFLKVYVKNFTGWGTIPRVDCPCRQVCNSETTDRHLRGNGDKVIFDFPSKMD